MSDYFETMGIQIVRGRSFQSTDTASSGMVAVVNEAFANTYWKRQNPIGRRLRPDWGDGYPWFTLNRSVARSASSPDSQARLA
jgi:hypothetical protein